MQNSSNCLISPPQEVEEGAREKFAIAWNLYLDWRGESLHSCDQNRRVRRAASTPANDGVPPFARLGEAETAGREALLSYFSPHIQIEFIMALMQSAADTTSRFMRANSQRASLFRVLAFDMLWSGLSAIGHSDDSAK
jgi:hypothetical protein